MRELAHLRHQFRDDPRISVINGDAHFLPQELAQRGIAQCDYVVSGIPFSTMEINKKRELLRSIFDALELAPHAAFIIYQVTNELQTRHHFPARRLGILPAKYSTDVHHGFS